MPKRFIAALILMGLTGLLVLSTSLPSALRPSPNDPTNFAIVGANVLTMAPTDNQLKEDWSVVVRGGRIEYAGPTSSAEIPQGAQIIDARGKTLMPGLIDMHVHVWDEVELGAFLAYGVTTTRNVSGMYFHQSIEARRANRQLLSPRFFTTGPIINSDGPNAQVNHKIVNTPEAGRKEVRRQYRAGYRRLKLYSNLRRDVFEAVMEEAATLGMIVMGHSPEGARGEGVPHSAPFEISFEEILEAGFTTLEHMETIVWHGLYDKFDPDAARELAKKIAASGTAVTPTLIVHYNLTELANTDGEILHTPEAKALNPLMNWFLKDAYAYWISQPDHVRSHNDEFYGAALKIFEEEGVRIVMGTDAGTFATVPGASMTQEIELYAKAGLPTMSILRAATINGAQVLGIDGEVGQIKTGLRADLLLIDGNPLEDLSAVGRAAGVVADGVWLDEARIKALKKTSRKGNWLRSTWRFATQMARQ